MKGGKGGVYPGIAEKGKGKRKVSRGGIGNGFHKNKTRGGYTKKRELHPVFQRGGAS